jgi:hypothetical protein
MMQERQREAEEEVEKAKQKARPQPATELQALITKHETTRWAPRAAAEAECPGPGCSRPPGLDQRAAPPQRWSPQRWSPTRLEPGCPGLERQKSAPWRVAGKLPFLLGHFAFSQRDYGN